MKKILIWTMKSQTTNMDPLSISWITINFLYKTSIILFLTQFVLKYFYFLFQQSISIEENSLNSNLLQITVIDLDEEFSANWRAVIFFISGNEGNWFEIEMNERTNVGTLKVVKVWYPIILYPIQYFVFLAFFQSGNLKMMLTLHKLKWVK